ncbi:Putative AC transposase [Linum grandiflorum]
MAVTAHYIDNSWKLRSHMLRFMYVPSPHKAERLAKILLETMMDWNIDTKLKIFNSITELFSGTTYPTANLFFPKICELKLKIAEWLIDPNTTVSGMAALMWDKFIKYWDSIHEILALAVVLDPRYKLDVIDYYCGKFGLVGLASSFSSDKIQQLMYDLIDEYQRKNSASTGLADSEAKSNSSSDDMDFEIFLSQRKKAKTSSYKSELDHYLSEDIIPRTSDFDILLWWKQNCPKYPTLGDIAKDLLAIPVSSVASESAFSSGGRLLDPHRSKLHYSTVEALMCTRTWIQDEFRREASTSANALEGCFSALSMNEIPAIPEAEIEGNQFIIESAILLKCFVKISNYEISPSNFVEEQVAMTKTAMNYHFDDID